MPQIPLCNWFLKHIFVTCTEKDGAVDNGTHVCSLDKDTVERSILTLKSLYPLTCDTDEKKRAFISAKMPFNIPNTVGSFDRQICFISHLSDLVKCHWWSATRYWRTMSRTVLWIWLSRGQYSCVTPLRSVSLVLLISRISFHRVDLF